MRKHTPTTLLRLSLVGLAVSQLFGGNAWAASEKVRIAELEKKLAQSAELIERLAARVGELEKAKSAPPPAVAPAPTPVVASVPAPDPRVDNIERSLAQMAEASARAPANAGVPVHGFADVSYASSNRRVADGRKRGFALGNVDFYLTPEFGDHIKSLIELNFEYGDAGVLATDLERVQIGYTFSDQLTVWAGRFHTPYGYWNTAYHHGAQIQTAVLRPKMVGFEDQGGILPAHAVGLWATGVLPMAGGKFEYDAYLANGNRIVDGTLDFNAVKDDNNNKLFGTNLRYRFGGSADGLVLGFHSLNQQVSASEAEVHVGKSKVNMLGAYGVYDGNDWDVVGEYYHFNNKDLLGNASHSSWAGFLQLGRNIGNDLTPYLRLEKASLNQNDSYFYRQESGRSYQRQALGVRYDINPKTALKMEMNRTDDSRDGGQKYNEAQVQVGVRF